MLGAMIERYGSHEYGPRAVNSLGETICLNCGAHFVAVVGIEASCSPRCRMQLWRRGGRMDWKEFRLRLAYMPPLPEASTRTAQVVGA